MAVPLRRQAETGFNGYDNYDANGAHPVVVVWRREREKTAKE